MKNQPKPSGATEVLSTATPALAAAAVARAVERLRAGELVGVPTETVYGLAANAWDAAAVQRLFTVKGRPSHNPIIVHVASLALARRCVASWPVAADRLAAAFWPGPLTLVLPRSAAIPDVVTAGGPTVGVRWPSHPVTQAIIRACGFPLAAPSANPSSQVSPTTAEHVRRGLAGRVSLILDGGSSSVGIESTVLDLTMTPPRVLRPGMVSAEALAAVLGRVAGEPMAGTGAWRSPGLLQRHYAPQARLLVWRWSNDEGLAARVAALGFRREETFILGRTRLPGGRAWGGVLALPRSAAAYARVLYAELYRCDEAGARLIIIEPPPRTPEWQGIRDRLGRASA